MSGITNDVEMALEHLAILFGDDAEPAFVFIGEGHDPATTDTGAVQYDRWNERPFVWPDDADAIAELVGSSTADLFVTPARSANPVRSARRKRLPSSWLWADIDTPTERSDGIVAELVAGGAMVVDSGSAPGRRHVYVPLEEPAQPDTVEALNRRLARHLGADPAVGRHNGFLRLAGSWNRKPTARGAGAAPVVLHRPNGAVFSVDDLDDRLPEVPATPTSEVGGIDLDAAPEMLPPAVRSIVEETVVAGMDRSARTMALIGACRDAGLSAGQALDLAHRHAPSSAKYGGRLEAEVARCWSKVVADGIVAATPERPVADRRPAGEVLTEAVETFRRWLHLPDPGPLYAVLAAVTANHFDGDPLWLLVVGPPSGGKTELLNAVARRPDVHPAATLTEAALLSGTPRKEAKGAAGGLLRVIGDFGILLLKDFTSVLAQNKDTRAQLLGALREIYDGSWTRHIGSDGGRTLHWEGKVGLVGGVTPALDRHHAVLSSLGDRFLLLRLPPVDAEEVGARAMSHIGRERQMRSELTAAADAVLGAADLDAGHRQLTDGEHRRLLDLAIFAVRARSAVERDGYSAEVLSIPEPEGPPRFLLALRRLLGGLEAIGCDADAAWSVLASVAVDSMPATRRRLLEALIAGGSGQRTGALASAADLPTKTAARHLEDLALLGLANRTKASEATNAPDLWSPSEFTGRYWPHRAPEIRGGAESTPEIRGAVSSSETPLNHHSPQEGESLAYFDDESDDLCPVCGERPAGSFSGGPCARCSAELAGAPF